MTGPTMPPFAHLPGRGPRHADGAFSDLVATARGDRAALERSAAWRTGLAWCDAGYYWEAHELFEAVWAALPQNAAERRMVQAMIQLANAGLKARMGQERAVARILDRLQGHLADSRIGGDARLMGLSRADVLDRIASLLDVGPAGRDTGGGQEREDRDEDSFRPAGPRA